MFRLCCTKKVLKRLKTKPEVDPPASTTTLSDWYVDVLILRPRHLLLFVNEKTRLPIVTEAAPIADLQPRFVVALFKQLLAIGIKPHLVDAEMGAMDQMGQMVVAKTASRSVLGTILDFRVCRRSRGRPRRSSQPARALPPPCRHALRSVEDGLASDGHAGCVWAASPVVIRISGASLSAVCLCSPFPCSPAQPRGFRRPPSCRWLRRRRSRVR